MPNRAQTAADTTAGYSLITRLRLTAITNDTGGVTTVGYQAENSSCAAGTFPSPDANTTTCYPSYWLPPGGTSPVEDWFNIYPQTRTTVTDTTGGDPPMITTYTDTGAAWHYDDDTVTRSLTQTWDQWRGYRTVTTETGTAPDPVTEQADTYFQGMNGDNGTSGTVISLTSSRGDTVSDNDQYAGMLFESIVYNGAGTGNEVTDTIHASISSTQTGTDSGLGLTSYMTEDGGSTTYTTLAGGGTRVSTVSYLYDSFGRVTQETNVADTSDPSQTTCTLTSYAANDVPYPSEVTVLATGSATAPCKATAASQLVSDTTYAYDSAWDTTKTQKATMDTYQALTGITSTYAPVQTVTYDEYGRPLTSADADNRTTTTVYTPAVGAEPTSVKVTDPVGLVTTTTYDPARDAPLTVTDPAGYVTAVSYDALGRATAKWTAGNPASGPPVTKYSYAISDTVPSVVTELTETPGGNYLTTQTISDSLGQARETQTQTASGGTDVADITYNSGGLRALTSSPYYVSGAPSGTLIGAAPTSVPSQTGYVYDGAGRMIKEIAYKLGTETWETDTTYGGNYVTVVPPSGAISQTTFSDGRGLTTSVYQYHAGVTASPSDPFSDYDKTSYMYTPAGLLASITDTAGNAWSWSYDLLGNQVSESDPDSGTSTATYDPASQTMSVTDARGKTVSYTYDGDGRKTAEYDTTGGALESAADELASWTYDTLAKGELTSSTAYEGGASYTEQISGYNSYELPSGTETIIPPAQGNLAGTYTVSYSYAPSGQMTSYTDSAAGGLPTETVTTGYDAAGERDSLTGADSYVDSLSYTNLGQPLQYTLGKSSEPAYLTDSYDAQTGWLTEQNTQTGTTKSSVDDLHYSYDNVGNITSQADTPSGDSGATDVQCFQYDYLDRLVQAWAQARTGCAVTPSASAEGGAAPYWDSYAYNTAGDLTGITSTTGSGTVTSAALTYPASGTVQPHTVTGQTVTAPSGTARTSYGYDLSGNLTKITGPSQSQALNWDDAGRLTQDTVTPSGGTARTASYIYDADGSLLLAADPGTTTLYLPDEELSLNTSTGTVTGTRYYALNSVTIAARTGASNVAYLAGDHQGTDSVAIDSATLNITRRYYDPYGNTRGTAPPSFPAGQKGFVGGTNDTATGLTNLGAREYQPTAGSFISADPRLNPYDPQDLNPYTYAYDNPTTFSDPTGKMVGGGGDCGGNSSACTHAASTTYHGAYGCEGSSQAAVNACVAARTPKTKPTNGQNRGAGSPPIVKISDHIYAVCGSQGTAQLQADWNWAVKKYGQPKNTQEEFNDWQRACSIGPYRCTGAMGADFTGFTPNINIEIGWNDGIKMLIGGGAVVGLFVPGVATYSSKLGRALIKMGYQPPDKGYEAHHIAPKGNAQAKQLLEDAGVGIDDAENGVWLPRGPSVVNWFNDVFHVQTFSGKYSQWVIKQLRAAGDYNDVVSILQQIRDALLSGDTPWENGPGDDGTGSGAGTGGE
jgi:RHS repeat-associated protein